MSRCCVHPHRLPEPQLVNLARAGDESACAEMVRRLRPTMRGIARQIDPGRIVPRDDLLAAASVAVLESLRRYDSSRGARFATYSYWPMRGAMIDVCNAFGARPEKTLDDEVLAGYEARCLGRDPEYGAATYTVDVEETRVAVRAFVDNLPSRQRDAVISVYFHGRTHAETAHMRGVSRQAVSKSLAAALIVGAEHLAHIA